MINKINSSGGISKIGGGFTGQGKSISQMSVNDISIHVMPEIFRKPSQSASSHSSSKKTGLIILVLGGLMLVGLLAGAYYFFVIKSKSSAIVEKTAIIKDKPPTNQPKNKNFENPAGKNQIAAAEPVKPVSEKSEQEVDTPINKKTNSVSSQVSDEKRLDKNDKVNKELETIEIIKAEETSTSTEEKKEIVSTKNSIALVDLDGDGLSSSEEAIFGTSDQMLDSDSDGYDDVAEIHNFYNPNGSGTLEEKEIFHRHISEKYNVSFLYPSDFEIISLSEDTIAIDVGNNELFNIFIQENVEKKPINEWYKELFSIDDSLDISSQIIANNGWEGVESDQSLIYYFTDPDKKYIFTFNYSTQAEEYRYKNIFDLIFKSFKVTRQ